MCQGSLSHLIRRNREHLPALPDAYDQTFVQQVGELLPHLKELRFNGGEPFTQQLVFDVCELVYDINPDLPITIATNGTVLNERVKSHLARGNFQINISIDSLQKERYEAIRVRADFDVLMDNFRFYRRYCKSNDRMFSVMINPMRHNWDEMGEMVQWSLDQDVRCWFNVVRYPLHSALWNLPSTELEHIHETLSRHHFELDETRTDRYVFENNMVAWHHLVDDQLVAWIAEAKERETAGETAHLDTTVSLSIGRKPVAP
jgi:molybdenum cofactor biosynthesis enzyme MoaA